MEPFWLSEATIVRFGRSGLSVAEVRDVARDPQRQHLHAGQYLSAADRPAGRDQGRGHGAAGAGPAGCRTFVEAYLTTGKPDAGSAVKWAKVHAEPYRTLLRETPRDSATGVVVWMLGGGASTVACRRTPRTSR